MSRKWWIGALCLVMPVVSRAQSSADSAAYKRAQSLVNDGNATSGRAIVDSIIARASPGTTAYAEGLYWRAVLAATAADAEMDYRRIVVDYTSSPRAEDALLRLAQLELSRADYDGALQHLNRLTLEHPAGPTRARAGYWTARVLFEKNDIPRACAANADALARANPDDTELRNQISYLNQRCAGVAVATAAPSAPPATNPPAVTSAVVPARDSAQAPKGDSAAKVIPPAILAKPATDTASSKTAAQKPPIKRPASPMDGKPSVIDGGLKAQPVLKDESPSTEQYSVQIAAYNVKSQAEAMTAKLKKKGYEARVSGTTAPFRVRIGHYATQAQATAVMRSLKAKQIDAFVVKAESK